MTMEMIQPLRYPIKHILLCAYVPHNAGQAEKKANNPPEAE
jgi:hypothetical protein